jgi:serine/threonine protein kinase
LPLSDLDQALLELAMERGVLTETGVHRVREAVSAPAGPDVESAIFDLVDGATFQKLCKDLPDFYARRLKKTKLLPPGDLAALKQWFGRKNAEAAPAALQRIGRYAIEAELGRGALGVVYRVRDDKTGERLALKVLSQVKDQTKDPAASQRFQREMKALARVDHPNVVRIRDVGEDRGRPFYVMTLIEGAALSERVERDGPLDPALVATIARDLLLGLEAIHAQSIVHRDVKPANVLLDATGRAVLIDFSVVHLSDALALTQEGFSVGTPVYMAPEQIAGEPLGPATDLYALGVTLFVALEGRSPYGSLASYDALAERKLSEPPPLVERPSVPRGLVPFVARLMARKPLDRFPSAAEARLALEAALAAEEKAPLIFSGYELLETVARGAATTVYRARSREGEAVALEVLDANAPPSSLERLTREARALGRVRHENVVGLKKGGIAEGRSFLALEWVEGESLKSLLARGPLALEAVLAIAVGLARGLASVHEKNVLHRDLRAENVLVANGTTAKLSGFGQAKIEGDEEARPAGEEPATRLSDLTALGAVLAEIQGPLAPLAPIVASLLATSPEKRYASASDLASDLALMASGHAPRALPDAPPPEASGRPWWKLW